MSDVQSSSSYSALEDPQWLCMVTLFVASLVTLVVYLVQYFQQRADAGSARAAVQDTAAVQEQEAAALLGWALSLKSWTSQWRAAWCTTLNEQSRNCGVSPKSHDHQSTRAVTGVTAIKVQLAACCTVTGKKLQFSVSATPTDVGAGNPLKCTVNIAPLELQLDLQTQEADDDVKIRWRVLDLDLQTQEADDDVKIRWRVLDVNTEQMQLTPTFMQDSSNACCVAAIKEQLSKLLRATHPSLVLSCQSARTSDIKACNKVASPPKPPRAHEWRLLVKNIRVALSPEDDAAGSMNPVCVLQLDDPPQRFSTSVLKNTTNPGWDQPFIFDLNGRSKELNIQLLNEEQPQQNSLLGQALVSFDLVKKQPKGQQTFALVTKDGVAGSLTTDFTYLDPSEVRSWQPPTPASAKRVEMDRKVMPCGTVVTTVTAVKSKPGRSLPPPGLNADPSQKAAVNKSKLSVRRVSEQPSMMAATVSKALSSSDTELLLLNGTDPVAEAAIRQLNQSAKQKLKSPVKKSTIIISGIAKTPLSQDDELALMAGYAAAMDASMSECSSTQDVTEAVASGTSSSPESSELQKAPSGTGQPAGDWESQTGEDVDNSSLSMCVSEARCKKSRGSFLQKSAKLFFRRRHQRKEPGMSQSHNDLVYLESAAAVDRASRTATLSHMLNRRLLSKHKSNANGSTSVGEPHA
ncbi:C2 domain-containing protein 2 [Thalassophryne amazonica]|uniref:C2 domain-containing protein 2 n=1 Tax=Thalassophryne amazonica TaxID=390379 RepID=UPI0014722039|nr:C2 domain-containing protein 2 [Thalassophryne amazonica]